MDAMPSCVGDAMPSVVGYYEQEFLVARLFAFFNVLTIFFGLFVNSGRWFGNAAAVCDEAHRELGLYFKMHMPKKSSRLC